MQLIKVFINTFIPRKFSQFIGYWISDLDFDTPQF